MILKIQKHNSIWKYLIDGCSYLNRNITFGKIYFTKMKLLTPIITLLFSMVVFGQLSIEQGEKVKFGKLELSNNEIIEFYNLEYGDNEKVNFINTATLQPEFLYASSIKSIVKEETSHSRILQIEKSLYPENFIEEVTHSTFELKDKKIELANPKSGKAVVYFVRTNSTGFLINFRYFDYDKFIGKFAGLGYIRYECDPGEHAFWVGASNSSYVTANLEEGKIYVIETIPVMGMAYARVNIEVANRFNDKKYPKQKKRIFAILSNKEFDKSPQAQDLIDQSDYKKEIERGIEVYNKRVKKDQDHVLHAYQYFE